MKNQEADVEQALKKVVLDVFEQLYFMFPQEIPVNYAAFFGRPCFTAHVALGEEGGMQLLIAGTEAMLLEMAKNMFGDTQTLSSQALEDVVREAANIIAGNLINECGFSGNLSADIAVTRSQGDFTLADAGNGMTLCFEADNEVFCVCFSGFFKD